MKYVNVPIYLHPYARPVPILLCNPHARPTGTTEINE